MILSPLVGKTSSYIKNSGDFVEFICLQELRNEVMVSFDVVSLFTNVPTELAIQVAEHYLRIDPELEVRTPLPVEEIISLLEVCLNSTYLQFRGSYYQQIHGTAMGSQYQLLYIIWRPKKNHICGFLLLSQNSVVRYNTEVGLQVVSSPSGHAHRERASGQLSQFSWQLS